jgi:hypothetical protein
MLTDHVTNLESDLFPKEHVNATKQMPHTSMLSQSPLITTFRIHEPKQAPCKTGCRDVPPPAKAKDVRRKRVHRSGERQYDIALHNGERMWIYEDYASLNLIIELETIWQRGELLKAIRRRGSTYKRGHINCLSFHHPESCKPRKGNAAKAPKQTSCWSTFAWTILIGTFFYSMGKIKAKSMLQAQDRLRMINIAPPKWTSPPIEPTTSHQKGTTLDKDNTTQSQSNNVPKDINITKDLSHIIEVIFNCSKIKPTSLRQLHRSTNCSIPQGNAEDKMLVFNATYRKLIRHVTRVTLHKCRMFLLELVCTESWRGVTGDVLRRRRETEIRVTPVDCMRALKPGETSAGKLQQTAPGSYITAIDINYKCRDWSTHTTRTHVFEMESFVASVSERDANIIQDLTISVLNYTKGHGHPKEQPLTVIVWETPLIHPDTYEELGVGETHRLGNLIYS